MRANQSPTHNSASSGYCRATIEVAGCPKADLDSRSTEKRQLADLAAELTGSGSDLMRGPKRKLCSSGSRPLDHDRSSSLVKEATQPLTITSPPNADVASPEPASVKDRSAERPMQFADVHKLDQRSSFYNADISVPVVAKVEIAECVCRQRFHPFRLRATRDVRNWSVCIKPGQSENDPSVFSELYMPKGALR